MTIMGLDLTPVNPQGRVQEIVDLLSNNGFELMSKTNQGPKAIMQFGAKTVNNLPVLFEVSSSGSSSAQVAYKIPVMPLKPFVEEAISIVFKSFKGELASL
mmetsp:Transcript_5495/g.9325  ORF Transcript_5495/g.9325 Transcript_5495/m.9325 type:complete len:101 (+) Transcript_5495:2853-3155(+)